MIPHYTTQTESSIQKTLAPAKLKEKLQSLSDEIYSIKEELSKEINTTQTLEKHNSLLLRQVDQLRSLFETFSEEIVNKINNSYRFLQEKLEDFQEISLGRILKLEKAADVFYNDKAELRNEIKNLKM